MYNLYGICVQLCHGRVSIFHVYAAMSTFFRYGRASFFPCTSHGTSSTAHGKLRMVLRRATVLFYVFPCFFPCIRPCTLLDVRVEGIGIRKMARRCTAKYYSCPFSKRTGVIFARAKTDRRYLNIRRRYLNISRVVW